MPETRALVSLNLRREPGLVWGRDLEGVIGCHYRREKITGTATW